MQTIGNISSFVTLISFIIYFIGKFIRIKMSKKLRYESIAVYYNTCENNFKIVDEYYIGSGNSEKIIVSSEVPLNWIKIYECEYDYKKNKFNKGKLIERHGFLRAGNAIQINTYLPCGMPAHMLEFERYDYLIGTFHLAENGKNGILEECVKLSHTLRSYLYYIFE
ncbi:hypothetical protein [Sedimentibacter sp.]|uniref:hypothetical protein n=2 Tax=Sedimentibacter sp. TaxID=1960295 RepID=UPI0028A93DED|nr:hypothetical protein [Sedimentibacter sp.]